MAITKKSAAKLKEMLQAKTRQKFILMHLPDDPDMAPHPIFWLWLIVLAAFLVSVVWQGLPMAGELKNYISYFAI